MTNLDSILKIRDITVLTNVRIVKAIVFPVVMWELDHKEGWTPKNWCFQIVVLEKTLESLLDCKEIQPVHPKGNQPWIFIGRTDASWCAAVYGVARSQTWLSDWTAITAETRARCCEREIGCLKHDSFTKQTLMVPCNRLWRRLKCDARSIHWPSVLG